MAAEPNRHRSSAQKTPTGGTSALQHTRTQRSHRHSGRFGQRVGRSLRRQAEPDRSTVRATKRPNGKRQRTLRHRRAQRRPSLGRWRISRSVRRCSRKRPTCLPRCWPTRRDRLGIDVRGRARGRRPRDATATLHAVNMPGAEDSLATDRTVGEERETVAQHARLDRAKAERSMRELGWCRNISSKGPLTAGQKEAVRLILSAKDRVVGRPGLRRAPARPPC